MADAAPEPTPAMERAAQPSDEDIERARLAWRRDAPPYFKYLVDAEVWEP